jgi:RimJ/RimL family protein N-acetyltransferase
MVKVFKTARLVIQLISEDDLEEVRLLHNDSSTLNWLSDTSIVSQEEQIKWFRNLMNNSKSRRYVARTIANSAIVGVFRLDYIDFSNKSAQVGLDVEKSFRQKGYATEIYDQMLSYIFDDLGMNRVGLVTLSNNIPALALYAKLGFKKEGTLRKAIFRNNHFVDLVQCGLLFEEWKSSSTSNASSID